ncbi:TolC family outer membrane protein [Ectothiorhodospiraceae bacterium 2226]|nr:TolC family outer membrane protein [Ectothiorhodospiraceae bacterium 2226]
MSRPRQNNKNSYRALGLTLGLLCLGGPPAALAQENGLSLSEAYQIARERDPQLAGAEHRAAAAGERIPQARAGLLPQVSATADVSRRHSNIRLGGDEDNGELDRTFTSRGMGLNVVQPLYDRPAREQLRQSRAGAEQASVALAGAEQELLLRVASSYFAVLAAAEQLATAEAGERAITAQQERARRAFELGQVTAVDVNEAEARADLARAQRIEAETELEIRRHALARVLGRPVGRLLHLTSEPLPTPPGEVGNWMERARSENIEVRLQQQAVAIAETEIARSRGLAQPRLDAVAGYTDRRGQQFGGISSDTREAHVGLQLNIPLYSGGAEQARVREVTRNLAAERAALQNLTEQAELEARSAFMRTTAGHARLQALEQAVRSAESALRSTQRGAEVGVRTNIDVLDALQQVFVAHAEWMNARFDYLLNQLQLAAAAGALEPEALTELDALLEPASAAGAMLERLELRPTR